MLAPRAARANGAFPDSQSILLPAARPSEITLVTNFGLVTSTSGGRSWIWSCEQTVNSLGYLYQYGPAPRTRLFALASEKLVLSDDGACGWQVAGGMVSDQGLSDFFPDPSNADRVLAVGFDHVTGNYAVFASHDGGTTFDAAPFRPGARTEIDGVEISRSDPHTIYVTTSALATGAPSIARSPDDGVTWQSTDLSATLGLGTARIVGVDPDDAMRVLLFFQGASRKAIALTRDGGQTVTVVLDPANGTSFNSFARTAAGTVLIAGADLSMNPVLYRSHDRGLTFTAVAHQPPQIRGMAARGGDVYAATNNFGDGYALGVSSDEGDTWSPLMSYDKINAIAGCLKTACQTTCDQEVSQDLFAAAVCSASPPVDTPDGGGDVATGGTTGAGGAGGAGGHGQSTSKSGGCAIAPRVAGTGAGGGSILLAAAGLALLRRRRRDHRRRR
jgi:hypothetical protein